jgi:hypothetical protein
MGRICEVMGSGAKIYIQNLIKIRSGIQKLMGEGGSQTVWWSHINFFFQNKRSRLKIHVAFIFMVEE